MPKINSYKTKQFLFLLIKLSIVFGSCYFIYIRLTTNNQLSIHTFWEIINKNNILSFRNSSLLLCLSILNWFIEVLKWKGITAPVKELSFKEAMQQSFGALTASLFTPNRIGEYGVKAIYFEKKLRKKIVAITLINNMGQMLVTLSLGILGVFFFIQFYPIAISYSKLYLLIGSFLLIILTGFFLLKMSIFNTGNFSIKRLKKFIKLISAKVLLTNISFAFLRYCIFSYQFYFLIHLFYPATPYLEIIVGITTFYLISSMLPMLFLLDVVVKSGVAVWVFSFLGLDDLSIVTIVTLMWVLNFVIPSIFGSYFVFNFQLNAPKTIDTKL